jgi:hypothetical protein
MLILFGGVRDARREKREARREKREGGVLRENSFLSDTYFFRILLASRFSLLAI